MDEQLRTDIYTAIDQWSRGGTGPQTDAVMKIVAPLLSGLDRMACGHVEADWNPGTHPSLGLPVPQVAAHCHSCQREAAAVGAALEQAAQACERPAIASVGQHQAREQCAADILALPHDISALDAALAAQPAVTEEQLLEAAFSCEVVGHVTVSNPICWACATAALNALLRGEGRT